jgi:hypothetical protein
MICLCGCEREFTPRRSNQVYFNSEHRKRDSNRRWPVRRQSSEATLRNSLGKRQEARTSYVTLLLGTEMGQGLNEASQGQERGKVLGDGAQAHLLTSFEVGVFLRVSRWTLMSWRKAGKGPPYLKISPRVVRYPVAGLRRFLNQHLGGSSPGQIRLFGGRPTHGAKENRAVDLFAKTAGGNS